MKQNWLYTYISALPPWVIMLYLYTKNAELVNVWQVLGITAVLSLLSLLCCFVVSRIGFSVTPPPPPPQFFPQCKKKRNPDTTVIYVSRAAFFTVILWVLVIVIMPLYRELIGAGIPKPLRYGISALCAAGGLGGAFALGNKIRRKEVFMLLAVFETVLFILNAVPAGLALAGKDAPSAGSSVTIDAETPSPNIYWLFMDGMLGFEGMERLFGDRQEAFTAALEGYGFRINRNAQFEVFHATVRATAALMSPGWYDSEFLPLLRTVDLDDYNDKEKKLGNVNPLAARRNNELLRAFRAKGHAVYTISGLGIYLYTSFHETADGVFYENKLLRNSGHPLIQADEPPILANEPLIQANEPLIQANEPLIQANEPPILANEPLIQANEPPIQANEPLIQANKPLIQANKPLIQANEPSIKANDFFYGYIQFISLNELLSGALAPWSIIDRFILKAAELLCAKWLNSEDVPQAVPDRTAVYGDAYDGTDQWYVDALLKSFTEPGPRLTIIHEAKAHYPFIRDEDGSLEARTETAGLDPANYPPQHRYAAKTALAYIALILEHDPDAVIVVQADHGLHADENREIFLEKGGTEEDVRIMQNQVMSAVRIPETWGGLEEPLDPLDISRLLVNRYVGKNYAPVAAHP
ncbi:MAG: hypothetical protein LBP37_04490 [Spirochaetaceae bacterium]|jgi:hypothetical protein|nr:hypothetical protein [Spirochaetaceae bacterium]